MAKIEFVQGEWCRTELMLRTLIAVCELSEGSAKTALLQTMAEVIPMVLMPPMYFKREETNA